MIVYEPEYHGSDFFGLEVVQDLDDFKQRTDIILANRLHENLENVADKVYTRDLKGNDLYNNHLNPKYFQTACFI